MFKKILLIGPLPKGEAYGVGLGFESLINGFQATNCDIKVVDIEGASSSEKVGSFELGRALGTVRTVLSVWAALPRRQAVYMTIASSRLGFIRDMLIIWAAWAVRVRIVLHLKGGGYKDFYSQQPGWLKKLIALSLSKSTHIVVLGNLLRDQFDFVPGIDKKLRVVPNGLTKGLSAPVRTKELPTKGQPLKILYLSNLIPSKGYLTLLEACAKLESDGSMDFICDYCGAFTQTIVDAHPLGAEQQQKEFLELINQYGLQEQVLYHGTVGGKFKQTMFEEAHLFVLPTRYPWEGQPISIIEALAFSTPVISTPHKGIPEEVLDGKNGYLVPPDNPDALAESILRVARDRDCYAQMSHAARQHFEANFTREVHLGRLMEVICGGRPDVSEAHVENVAVSDER